MAAREPKDLLTMLADRGEEAIQRLSDAPGAERLLGAAQALRDRLDELQKRMRGIDVLERRVAELEKRVEALSAPSTRSRSRAGAASRSAAAKKRATPSKTETRAKRSSSSS
jgi:hypothetical protein